MTVLKYLTALLSLSALTACDRVGPAELATERADRTYSAAMDDYRSGRIPQALTGLRKACAENPSNASARFQLACLLQDVQKDYLGAFCAYREYLLQRPDSEKAKLAADRLATCEREMAKSLAEKYATKTAQEAIRSAQESRAARSKAEAERAKLVREIGSKTAELEALRRENARLKKLMRDEAAESEGDSLSSEIAAARVLKDEDASQQDAKGGEIDDAKRLLDADASNATPVLSPKATVKSVHAKAAESATKPSAYPHETRPSVYVVQDGDTLYKIAIRFYGHASAWNRIRAANRATISTDGRVRKGQKLVLPPEDR